MTRRTKWGLVVFGLTCILISIVFIAYGLWPLPGVVEQVPLAPTLFAPPP